MPLLEVKEAWRYRDLIQFLVQRDMTARYKRSVLGIAWTMLNPLGMMIVLSVVFSQVFRMTMVGYPAYVLSGLIAWNFFSQTTSAAMMHLVWGEGLLKRIYVPRTVFAVSAVGTGLVNVFLSIFPLLLVMLLTGVPIRWTVIFLPVPVLFLTFFAIGVGLLLSAVAVFFADVAEMYQVGITAWMYLSPVIYPVEYLSETEMAWIGLLNPMYHLITLFRAPIYDGVIPDLTQIAGVGAISIAMLLIGWVVFTRKADEIAYRI